MNNNWLRDEHLQFTSNIHVNCPRVITFPSDQYCSHSPLFQPNPYFSFNNNQTNEFLFRQNSSCVLNVGPFITSNNINTSQQTFQLESPKLVFFTYNQDVSHNWGVNQLISTTTNTTFNTRPVSDSQQPSLINQRQRNCNINATQFVPNLKYQTTTKQKSVLFKNRFLEERELDDLVSRIAEEASKENFKITWPNDDETKAKINHQVISCSNNKENGSHRPRKQAKPCRSATKHDPSFEGVALTMQIKVNGQQSQLTIHPVFSSKLNSKKTWSKKGDTKNSTENVNKETRFCRKKSACHATGDKVVET